MTADALPDPDTIRHPAPASLRVPVIAVHGNGGGAFRFRLVAPHVPSGIVWRPITLPGFSTSAPDPSLRTVADYGRHLARLCDETAAELGTAPVLLGHGIGGSIALDMLQRRADAVSGLILHAPVGANLDQRLFPLLMRVPGMKPTVQRLIASRSLRPLWRKNFFTEPIPPAYLAQFFEEYRACSVFTDMFDVITPSWFDALRPVDVPTVLLWGEKDRVLAVSQLDTIRDRLVPGAVARVVPHWDHFPMIEQPAEYARVIAELAERLVHDARPA
jgi:pimeloyl-ACP methyl ester carboxylesterase